MPVHRPSHESQSRPFDIPAHPCYSPFMPNTSAPSAVTPSPTAAHAASHNVTVMALNVAPMSHNVHAHGTLLRVVPKAESPQMSHNAAHIEEFYPTDEPSDDDSVALTHRQMAALPHLVESPTVSEGARQAGISRRTVHRWMEDDHFRAEFDKAQERGAQPRPGRAEGPYPQGSRRSRPNARRPLARTYDCGPPRPRS